MCNKSNLPNRVAKAKAAMHFAQVTQYDANGKIRSVILPGSNGKTYQVIVRRNGCFSTELLMLVNGHQRKPRYAAQITYHQLTVAMLAAQEAGFKVTWTSNEQDSKNLSNLGGTVFCIKNHDNPNSVMFGIMKKEK